MGAEKRIVGKTSASNSLHECFAEQNVRVRNDDNLARRSSQCGVLRGHFVEWHLRIEAVFVVDLRRNDDSSCVRDSRYELLGKRRPVGKWIPFRQNVFKINGRSVQKPAIVQHRSKEAVAEISSVVVISPGNNNGQHQSPCAKTTREPGALIPTFRGSMRGSAA